MSVNYGVSTAWINSSKANSLPGLISSNLYFAYDIARPLCYPGTGVTVTDLVSTNNGNMETGATYDSENYGTIALNGSTGYISIPTFNLRDGSSTVYFWVKTAGSLGGLFSHWNGGPVGNAFAISSGKAAYYYYDGQWNYVTSTGVTVATNNWVHIAYTRPALNTGSMKIYVNGVLDYTFAPRIAWGGYSMGCLGCVWGPGQFLTGKIGMCLIYNDEHTITQVQQQFSANRLRYGI
jgi:hypothetical protein